MSQPDAQDTDLIPWEGPGSMGIGRPTGAGVVLDKDGNPLSDELGNRLDSTQAEGQ